MGKEGLPRSIVLGLSVCLPPPHPSSFAVLPQSWSQVSSLCDINPRDAANGQEAVLGTQEGPKKDIAAAGGDIQQTGKGREDEKSGKGPQSLV